MKSKFIQKIIGLSFVSAIALFSFACQEASSPTSASSPNPAAVSQTAADLGPLRAETPTAAYKSLYEAVKAKNTERIKQLMSSNTMTFAGFASQQQNQSLEKFFVNGLTATTFADNLPEIRDERVKDKFGAVEVFNQKDNRWEDLPFVYEDGNWKLGVGDAFKGDYKSPGKGKAQIEMEASGAMGEFPNAPVNTNGNSPKLKNGEVKSVEVPTAGVNKSSAKADKK